MTTRSSESGGKVMARDQKVAYPRRRTTAALTQRPSQRAFSYSACISLSNGRKTFAYVRGVQKKSASHNNHLPGIRPSRSMTSSINKAKMRAPWAPTAICWSAYY
jgi:hypothetical protein